RAISCSCDYNSLHRVLIATIRGSKGNCPCPRCFTPRTLFGRLGTTLDLSTRWKRVRQYFAHKVAVARRAIYTLGVPIKGAAVERLLKEFSMVPTANAFVERLSPHGFDIFPALVVDILHEFELGVWKAVLKHLIRILYAIDPDLVAELDNRFRSISPFGKGGIRRFPKNVSALTRRAARDFEDILQGSLQCAIPTFERMFPEKHDDIIRTLLFRLAEWHALAKLRLHSDDSLDRLTHALKKLGTELRRFCDFTCSEIKTMELPQEVNARIRRSSKDGLQPTSDPVAKKSGPRPKTFNLLTYKLHALGDYVASIKLFGSTDSYTTQLGELAHRLIKKFYANTNKRNVSQQLAKQERRHTRMRRQMGTEIKGHVESVPALTPELHHNLSDAPSNVINLASFFNDHREDPAVKDHLLSRLYGFAYDGDEHQFTETEHTELRFLNGINRIYQPKRFQVNYTTYDIRRDQDTMRPGHNSTVMTLSREDGQGAHPFWYARVLRAFHIDVLHVGPNARVSSPQTMEFLWVRWLGVVPNYRWGFKEARLPKVGFVSEKDDHAFGFLDPSLVIRGCHLIPAFADARTDSLLRPGPSIGRLHGE
ncbi:hypothetical protein BJ138DRAFT_1200325, partial [Hygrophoropsis aurantiaca]